MSSRGVIVGGVAGSGVQVCAPDRDPVLLRAGTAGDPALLDDETIVYRTADDTLRSCSLWGDNDSPINPRGASALHAGGGRWIAFLAGAGVRTSWGLKLPAAAALGMAPDGTAFVQMDYQADRGIAVYRPNQLVPAYVLPEARVGLGQFACLDGDRFVWTISDRQNILHASGLPTPAQLEPAYGPALVEVDGAVWVAYTTNTQPSRLLLHPLTDASRGFVVATGDTFGHVLWSPAPGTIEVAYARTQGETGPIKRVRVNLADAQQIPAPQWPRFGRKVGIGYFWNTNRRQPDGTGGNSYDSPGHFEILTDGAAWKDCANKTRPVIADLMSEPSVPVFLPDSQTLALYALFVVVPRDDIATALRVAEQRRVPILWYEDQFPYQFVAGASMRPGDLPMLRGYPDVPLSSIGPELARLAQWWPQIAVAWPSYVQAWSLDTVTQRQRPQFDIVRNQPAVTLIGCFCGPARQNGIGTYPELAEPVNQMLAASEGLPDLGADVPDPGPTPEPEPEPISDPFFPRARALFGGIQ